MAAEIKTVIFYTYYTSLKQPISGHFLKNNMPIEENKNEYS
jgi:hypothetical protein